MRSSESPRIGTGESLEGRSKGRSPRIEVGGPLEGRSAGMTVSRAHHGGSEQDSNAQPGYAVRAGAHDTAWTMLCRMP